jgi:steroid delta-isomerase-like uncharacterized protein
MSAETNKALARRVREELWTAGNLALADELYASDATSHALDPLTPDFGRGPEAIKQMVRMYRTPFPDAQCTIEDVVAEGDRVVVRWTARATQKGDLAGIAATGKRVTVTGTDTYRFAGGKIKEEWINWDALGLLQQLGATQRLGQAVK